MSDGPEDPELISTPGDRTPNGIPRHSIEDANRLPGRRTPAQVARDGGDQGAEPRRPAVWNPVPTLHDPKPTPVYGAFPVRFVPWALRRLRCSPSEVLHVCSGMLTAEDVGGGTRVDIRPEAHPDIVADGRDLPFADGYFGGVLIDPPYSVEYARDLYGTEYPRPSHLLREAARVVRPCGRIGFLHYLVPNPPPGCRIVAVRGVTQGCGYRIRAFTVYEREQDQLPGIS